MKKKFLIKSGRKNKRNKFCYVPIDDVTFKRVLQYIKETQGHCDFFPTKSTAVGLFCRSYDVLVVDHYYVSDFIKRVDGSSDFGYLIITSANIYSVYFEAFGWWYNRTRNVKSDCPEELLSIFWEAMDYMEQNSMYDWIKEHKNEFCIELTELGNYRRTKYLYDDMDLWRWKNNSQYSKEWGIYKGDIVLPTKQIPAVFKRKKPFWKN